ncbi:MAG: adenosine deaminase, partial [Cephaloticoccus sp.]
ARVREAIEVLGVTRVQHGVRAIEDPAVVALARDRGVTFDVCPISNIRLAVFPDFASHPLRRLSAAGVLCTISTDDPLCFNNRLVDEYRVLEDEMGCDRAALARYAANGWEVADVPEDFRRARLAEIDRLTHAA